MIIQVLRKTVGLVASTILFCGLVAASPALASEVTVFSGWQSSYSFLITWLAGLVFVVSSKSSLILLAYPGPNGEAAPDSHLRDSVVGVVCALLIVLTLVLAIMAAGYLVTMAFAGIRLFLA